jgi:hypothetical protein
MSERSPDRLYLLLPGHLRARDHVEGRPLQALLRIVTRELDVVEDDIQTLYENWFIETCEDWVVPYIGDLVGARPLRPFGEGGGSLRAYVANTLSYRQAKGTTAVVEQLARDVTGWSAHAVEFFRRLIQTQNVNHVRLDNLATVSLRGADAATQIGTAFETAAHVVDVRPPADGEGRYNIPNVGVFLWRLQSVHVPFVFDDEDTGYRGGMQPKAADAGVGFLHLDPLGRDLPMFNRARTEPALAHLAAEVDMPGRLRRRPLHDDLEAVRAGTPGAGIYFGSEAVLRVRLAGVEVPAAKLHACNLEHRDDGSGGTVWRRPSTAGEVFFDPELGRLSLHTSDEGKVVETAWAYGAAHDIGGGPYDRRTSIESWIEPFSAAAAASTLWQVGVSARAAEVTDTVDLGGPVVATLAAAIERWNAAAAENTLGIITILDNASYLENLTDTAHRIRIPAGASLAIVAAGWAEAEIEGGGRRRQAGVLSPQDRRPHVGSGLRVIGKADAEQDPGTLIVDGLLIEGSINVLDGDLGRLEIRHSSVGAGADGLAAGVVVKKGNARLAVVLDHALSGASDLTSGSASLTVTDSLIGEDESANPDPASVPLVINAPGSDLELRRCTVFGRIKGRTLEADATIFAGAPWIARRQEGCVRFSYVPAGARTPRRYRCAPELTLAAEAVRLDRELTAVEEARIRARLRPIFTSSAFGDPAFGQLALTCPSEIAAGAEQGAEMGAMSALGNPARVANLRDALDEYLPLGLEAGIIFVT